MRNASLFIHSNGAGFVFFTSNRKEFKLCKVNLGLKIAKRMILNVSSFHLKIAITSDVSSQIKKKNYLTKLITANTTKETQRSSDILRCFAISLFLLPGDLV